MPNNTFEDYKIAVKKKYEVEKEGRHSNFLSSPTRAKLRDLCWEIFERGDLHRDDLIVFNSFFGFAFDLSIRNKFREEIDKFRPIETFFKGETDPANVEAVNLGAILLDFHPRPFSKFRVTDLMDADKEIDKIVDFEFDTNRVEDVSVVPMGVDLPIGSKQRPFLGSIKQKFLKKSKGEILSVAFICCSVPSSIYLTFFKKECMQWSNDHYEFVDCDLKVEGFASYVAIAPLDERVVDLKKIKVCDTTTFFNKNEEPVTKYAKTGDSIEYFNQFAPHPLVSGKYLKPITKHMIRKYVNGTPCK